jgi:hypothetical protein
MSPSYRSLDYKTGILGIIVGIESTHVWQNTTTMWWLSGRVAHKSINWPHLSQAIIDVEQRFVKTSDVPWAWGQGLFVIITHLKLIGLSFRDCIPYLPTSDRWFRSTIGINICEEMSKRFLARCMHLGPRTTRDDGEPDQELGYGSQKSQCRQPSLGA